jgi:RNA polymerase sigma-70 factor (ECF subfamily)
MPRQKLFLFRSKDKAAIADENDFVRRCLEGDTQAFEKIVEKYRNQVFWTAYHLVLDYEDARDVAQQTFIKVWRSLPEFDSSRSLGGWISKIAANCAIDSLRTRRESEPLVDIPAEDSTVDRNMDVRKIFLRVAPLLSQRQRIVLVLREVSGMEISEIAGLMHCTESTVRNLLSQAKDSFRKKVKELFPDYGL